jgi:hypothetical protein
MMDPFTNDDWLCDEAGDSSFRQMAQHEGGHAVASRLAGVKVEVLKVSQRLPEDRFDRLSPNATGCSYCNNVPASFAAASWHAKALIKRAGFIAEQRHCDVVARRTSEPVMDNRELRWLFGEYAGMGDPSEDGRGAFERFVGLLDEKLIEWLDRSDVRETFGSLMERIVDERVNQGQGIYLCVLDGTAVDGVTGRLAVEAEPLINWP